MERPVVWVLAALWGGVAAAFLAGWLTPDLRVGEAPPAWLPLAILLLFALLLVTLVPERKAPPGPGRRARLALALGTSHVAAFVLLLEWGEIDLLRNVRLEAAARASAWALAVLLAAAALPAEDGRVRAWALLGRAALAGAALGPGIVLLSMGSIDGFIEFLFSPLLVLAAAVGAVVGVAFGVVDLALVRIAEGRA